MRIIFVITGLSTGGAEMMLLKVLEKLDARFSPHVISLTTPGEIGPRIQALGIPVETLGMRPGAPSPLAFFRLVRRLKTLKPDVVHTWMYHADLMGGLASKLAGIRAVGWAIHNSDLSPEHSKRSTLRVVKACAVLSHWVPGQILSCSEMAKAIHVSAGYDRKKMAVIPNGFDLHRFRPDPGAKASVRHELGVPMTTPLVGLFARFDPQKNHEGFIEAAALLHRQRPDVHFVLAGTDVDRSNEPLLRTVESAGAGNVSHLLGRRDDIPRLMAALDILVSSSSYGEAFPLVLGEAMACGVPCAATDVGDSAYIVGDTGHVVQPGDMAGLAEAMGTLLALSPAERISLGERARARVAEHFEIGKVVKRYEMFYDELAASRRRR